MQVIIERLRYDTETATLIADDRYFDGHNFERSGRNTYLYRTPGGRYFLYTESQWQGEFEHLEPVTADEAEHHYEELHEKRVPFEQAFPDAVVENA